MNKAFKSRYEGYETSPIIKIGNNEVMTIDKIAEIAPVSETPDNDTFNFTISTSDLDRCNDSMIATGAVLDMWNKNPVVLSRHNSYDFPYGKGLSISVVGNGLVSQAKFHDYNDEAILIRKLLNGGYLKTTSVGFIPRKWEDRAPLASELLYPTWDSQPRVRVHTMWELLEFSVCTIPMNGFCTMKDSEEAQKGILQAVQDGIILLENKIVVDILKKTNYQIPKINLRTIKMAATLTPEQVSALVTATNEPFIKAIVDFLTVDPYNLTPEDATAYGQEYVAGGSDAVLALSTGADTDAEAPAEEAAKAYKSKVVKSLLSQMKAGAAFSAAHKADVAAANDSAMEHAKKMKALNTKVSAAKDDSGDKSITLQLENRALKAENELLKSKQIETPALETKPHKGMTDEEMKQYLAVALN